MDDGIVPLLGAIIARLDDLSADFPFAREQVDQIRDLVGQCRASFSSGGTSVPQSEAEASPEQEFALQLHNHVGPTLTAAGLQLDVLRLDSGPAIAPRTREIQSLLDRAIDQVRDLSYLENPRLAERLGLRPALERIAEILNRQHCSVFLDIQTQAVSVYSIALYALRYAASSGCEDAHLTVRGIGRAYEIEVLYHVGSSEQLPGRKDEARSYLALLHQYVTQTGARLSIVQSDEGKTSIRVDSDKTDRADDDHALRGPVG